MPRPTIRTALLQAWLVVGLWAIAAHRVHGQGVAATASGPALQFTAIPAIGSSDPLRGRALNVTPAGYRVAVFINVFGWWTKPSWAAPLTSIQGDGSWTCNIVTGGSDACATAIAAFLVPASYSPPLLGGQSQLPSELNQNAVAQLITYRVPTARTLRFAGYDWNIKSTGNCQWGPGPNYYSDSTNNVWLDSQARLHLRLTHRDNGWQCAEVTLQESLGYGTYKFLLESAVDQLDPSVVLGFFTWTDDPAFDHREIDIEFSRWSAPNNPNNAQFVVQPFTTTGHLLAFLDPAGVSTSTHLFSWEPTRVLFQSLRGFDPYTSSIARTLRQWTFTKTADIPKPGDAKTHINLWLFNSVPPLNGQEVEIVIHGFEFIPALPTLNVTRNNGGLLLSWPAGYFGFHPETSLTPLGSWSPFMQTATVAGDQLQVNLAPRSDTLFLRLSR